MKYGGKIIAIVCILVLTLSIQIKAQITSGRTVNIAFDDMMRGSVLIGPDRYINVKGNPFIAEEFQLGEVIHMDSSITREVPMRLNHHTDEIEFKMDDKILVFAMPRKINYVTFGHRSFAFFDYVQQKKTNAGYFEVLAWGDCKLLLRRNTIIKREELPPSDMGGGNFKDYFRTTEEYFLKKGTSAATQIQKSKKSILKTLGEHEEELTDFIEKNKLKLKSEEDMIDLIYFYNSITKKE